MHEGQQKSSLQTLRQKLLYGDSCLLRARLSTPASLLWPEGQALQTSFSPLAWPKPSSFPWVSLDCRLEGSSLSKYLLNIHTTSPIFSGQHALPLPTGFPNLPPTFADTPTPFAPTHCLLYRAHRHHQTHLPTTKHANLPTAAPSAADTPF